MYAIIKVYIYLQLLKYPLCKYKSMEIFMYKRKKIYKCAGLQIFKCLGIPLCMYTNMQIGQKVSMKEKSMQVSKYMIMQPSECATQGGIIPGNQGTRFPGNPNVSQEIMIINAAHLSQK